MSATPNTSVVRRAFRAASAVAALAVVTQLTLLAGPASASVPEDWSDPDKVDKLHAIGLLVGVPLLLFVVIALLVYLPGMAREAVTPQPGADSEWFGGKRSTAQLADPDNDESKAGGASGQW